MKYKVIGHQYRNDQCLWLGQSSGPGFGILGAGKWRACHPGNPKAKPSELSRPGPRRHYFRPVGRADWPRRLHSGTAQLGCNGGLEH